MMTSDLEFLKKFYHFSLEHNPHKEYYVTVNQYIGRFDHMKEDIGSELSKCVEMDDLWTLQVYPITPISFYWFGASSLEKLLEIAKYCLKDRAGV